MPAAKHHALSSAQIRNLTTPGAYTDGNGLVLRVDQHGKRWIQRLRIDGKGRNVGLGSFPSVSLAQAREIALDNLQAVKAGRNPIAEKRAAKDEAEAQAAIPTFAEVADRVIQLRRPTWRNAKHAAQWRSTLEAYAFPTLGKSRVNAITAADVLTVLTPIWTDKPETATRVRQRVETVLDFAVTSGWRLDNPAGKALLKVLPNTRRLKEHHAALPYADVPVVLRKIGLCTAYPLTKLAFRLLVLTATRSGEVRGADWQEVDWETQTWTVPASRMKAGKEHRTPLSAEALAVLRDAWDISGPEGLIFPAKRSGAAMSDMTLTEVLRRLEIPSTAHGMRSSFRDWAAECSGASWAVSESALAHTIGSSTEQAYMRSDLLEQRRELMQEWACFCVG